MREWINGLGPHPQASMLRRLGDCASAQGCARAENPAASLALRILLRQFLAADGPLARWLLNQLDVVGVSLFQSRRSDLNEGSILSKLFDVPSPCITDSRA